MARTVTPPPKTALTANTELEAHLDFRDPTDPENVVLADMKWRTRVTYDDGTVGTLGGVRVSDVLSGTELSNFRAALNKLKNADFDASGIPDV
jgi:hypothetical protein